MFFYVACLQQSCQRCGVIRPHRSTVYVDAAYCYGWCSMVCLSVTILSPAKTAEPIEMLFGLWMWVGRRNHVLEGVQMPMQSGNFEGEGPAHCKV